LALDYELNRLLGSYLLGGKKKIIIIIEITKSAIVINGKMEGEQ